MGIFLVFSHSYCFLFFSGWVDSLEVRNTMTIKSEILFTVLLQRTSLKEMLNFLGE